MSLNNIFQMIKADRYTAAGREEIKKALAEETEDRTYNIGEISEKTGLQKTANGWAKPAGLKGLSEKGKEEVSKNVAARLKQNEQSYEKYKIPRERAEAIRAANRNSEESNASGTKKSEKVYSDTLSESKPESKKEDVRKQLLELEKQRRSYKDDTVENYAGHNIRLKQASLLRQAGFNGRSDFDNYLKEKMPKDSAPRVLTGDCKIRIRK